MAAVPWQIGYRSAVLVAFDNSITNILSALQVGIYRETGWYLKADLPIMPGRFFVEVEPVSALRRETNGEGQIHEFKF